MMFNNGDSQKIQKRSYGHYHHANMSKKQYEMLVTCTPWIATNLKYTNPYLNYHPELDITPTLDADDTNLYQSYTSILRWIVELRQLDIYVHVAFLSSFLTNPRIGHMEAVYHIFGYLKYHDRHSLLLCYFLSVFFYAFLFVQEHFPLFSRNHKKKHHTDIYDKNMQLHFNCLLNPILIILLQWIA